MSKRPSTHEEWVDAVRAVVERLRGDAELRDADGRTIAAAVIRDDITIISALLPPLPEPIKVGDRVRQWVIDDLMNYVETHQRYWELTTREVVAEAFGVVFNGDGGALAAFQRVLGDDFILHAADDLRPPAPAPSDTEQPEPVECSDPEALAAAVAAGLTVNPRPPGADWRDRQTYDRTVSAFREALDYGFRYRIHGTVPGYGETGGAS